MTNQTTARETVVGVFADHATAQAAIEQLKEAGFRSEDIGILMQDKQGAQDLATETGTQAGAGAATGAVTGGVLGGLGGLLLGLGALAIPGIGPILAAGPLAAALGGAVLGAGAGAIVGALVGLGVPEGEARVYEERFKQGRILVTVKAGAARYDEASQILRSAGAEDIQFGSAQAGTARAYSTGQSYTQGATASPPAESYTQGQSYGTGQVAGEEAVRVPVVEETLTANKSVREAGQVEVRKNVVEEQVAIPVDVSHEEVTVTRRATDRPVAEGEQVLEDGQVIRVPVSEETVDVQKQARVTGEVEIGKQRVSEQRTVSDTVRREEVDVQPVGEVNIQDAGRSGQRTASTYDQSTASTYEQDTASPPAGSTYSSGDQETSEPV